MNPSPTGRDAAAAPSRNPFRQPKAVWAVASA